MTWLSSPSQGRLAAETDRLLQFGEAARTAVGFGWLDDAGRLVPRPILLWITCRMTHVYSLGDLLGRPGAAELVDHGIAALGGGLRDAEHGGWFTSVDDDGPVDARKAAYPHSFVILAGASATAAGRPGGRALLDDALEISLRRFWDDEAGMVVESWDRAFAAAEPYRGVNAAMHTVEAYLAATDVTGDGAWLDRAARMTRRVLDLARGNDWRIPEHFDPQLNPLWEYNAENPADAFRPFGATIGHSLEWSRLTLHLRAALAARSDAPDDGLLADATALFDAAVRDGWEADGAPGFVYTVDWDGQPVVRERLHWVLCEALGAAAALHDATGEPRFDEWYRRWWAYAEAHLIDHGGGSWWHELTPEHVVSRTVWSGKPDVYHALQATLIPRLPLTPTMAPALAAGLLRVT
jgi:mannose/cellobiose epimerase-like protein (N-acyl-D-glucosamine 2-epimerase family)